MRALSTPESAEDLARLVVHRVAPEEDEIFDAVVAARRSAQPGGPADEVLGFGVEAAVTLLTPVVIGAVSEVLSHLAVESVSALDVRSRLRKVFRRRSAVDAPPAAAAAELEADTPVSLDQAERTAVRDIVLAKCRQAGVEEDRAELVADAVLGVLSAGD